MPDIKIVPARNYGTEAGTTMPNGRRLIVINGKAFLRPRIIWTMLKGKIPDGKIIDHKDRDPSNDRIGNLRAVSQSRNMQNKGLSKLNTSGFRGVWFCKASGRWQAACKANGKRFYGGNFATKEEAGKAAANLRKKHHK